MFLRSLPRQRLAMKTALAAASPLLVCHVREDAPTRTATPIAPRQQFEKTFTLSSAADSKSQPVVQRLVVQAPGLTFVTFDADATTAMVKISSELPDALDAFQVRAHTDGGLEISVDRSLERQYLLTEVLLPTAHTLHSLDVTGGGTVVIQDNVLVNNDANADVRINVRGSGDVFATSHSDLRVKSLTLDLSGSGDVQFVAPSISAADRFAARITSSGDLCVFTGSATAPQIELGVTGSGDLQLAALALEASQNLSVSISGSGNVTTIGDELKGDSVSVKIAGSGDSKLVSMNEFTANTVDVSVAGSGDVKIASTHARSGETKISVAGSGTVDARDLVAKVAGVRIAGSGDALFRASEVAEASVRGSGSAVIVGQVPQRVTGNPTVRAETQKPSLVEKLSSKRRTPMQEPTKVDAFEKLTGFNGTYNVTSFSEFISAVKMLWNGSGNKIIYKTSSATTEP